MKALFWLIAALAPLSCAEAPAPVERPAPAAASASPVAEAPPVATASASPTPTPRPVPSAHPAAVPPLKTPNALASSDDAGAPAPAPAPNEDARTAAIRRIGQLAQSCQSKHASNAGGKLVMRLSLGSDGHVTKVDVLKDATAPALLGDAFVHCVSTGAASVKFPTPRDEDTELEVPIQFSPVKDSS